MSSFDARLRVPGQGGHRLDVVVDIADGRIKFTSGDKPLGAWTLGTVPVDLRPDGFHLRFDHEEIVLTVTDPARFAGALGVGASPPRQRVANAGETANVDAGPSEQRDSQEGTGISSRLEGITPEEQFSEVTRRISDLRSALADASVPPQEVFGRWLRLLKEINLRHGQGAMPTPSFYRLNTELLELIPAPPRAPQPDPHPVAAGVGV